MNNHTNFPFLTDQWAFAATSAHKAELYAVTDPTASAIYSRKTLEKVLEWLYDHDTSLTLPGKEKLSLNDLLWERSFQTQYGPLFGKELGFVKKIGNNAAHNDVQILAAESISCVKYLFRFTRFLVATFSENVPDSLESMPFREELIPQEGPSLLKSELEKLRQQTSDVQIELERQRIALSEASEENARLKAELERLQAVKAANADVVAPAVMSEAETRRLYIDVMLREAGWNPEDKATLEVSLEAVDEATGQRSRLRADYVLWGSDGKPLAVVEAKRTSLDADRGRRQAFNYANALEQMYGQRPVIFYTNGFDTYIWDDATYPAARQVYGLYTADELQTLINRRTMRQLLAAQPVNRAIVDRPYQERVIRRVTERFESECQRRALLVMATGTGKTRVSAALVDLLAKAGWVKRILFLADRNALVTQAKRGYGEYVKNQLGVDLTQEADDGNARIVFSTYPTMMNRIDADFRNGRRYYGVGHFDLIIIDEAHRSVYDKYGALFQYFDGLFLGLTATPKGETDRDTYQLFNCLPNEPTDAYEYDTAVAEGYLVPAMTVHLPLRFPQMGIRYADLSEDEKREWERKFYDPETGEIMDEISAGAINEWLFNTYTVDEVLKALMRYGHKVEGGEKIAKTIIFAKNHKHADFIKQRFRALYPQFHDTFAEVIDNQVPLPQKLIDEFRVPEKFPQIAISVDMLDTGIDVPEVANLVLFKPVYSAAKFWQMLGRGTRLRKNLYGAGEDKENFYVFDVCGVFDFFAQNPEGIQPSRAASLSERIFGARVELAYLLEQAADYAPDSDSWTLRTRLVQTLHGQVSTLDARRFEVQLNQRLVEYFRNRSVWNTLTTDHVRDLRNDLAPLIQDLESDEHAKRFDLLMLNLMLAVLRSLRTQVTYIDRLRGFAKDLLANAHIPSVAPNVTLLKALQQTEFWQNVTPGTLEDVRQQLRDLIKLVITTDPQATFYTNFQDEFIGDIVMEKFEGSYANFTNHKEKLRQIIRANENHLTIRKIYRNEPITSAELDELDKMLFSQSGLDTVESYQKALGIKPLTEFIRSVTGLDPVEARKAFAGFLNNGPLSSDQIMFIDELIRLFTRLGNVEPNLLFEAPMFTRFHEYGVAGVFPEKADNIIDVVSRMNQQQMAG